MEVTSTNFAFYNWLDLKTGIKHRFIANCSRYRNHALAVLSTLTSVLNKEGAWS